MMSATFVLHIFEMFFLTFIKQIDWMNSTKLIAIVI